MCCKHGIFRHYPICTQKSIPFYLLFKLTKLWELDYSQAIFVIVYYFSYKHFFDASGNNFKDEVTRKGLWEIKTWTTFACCLFFNSFTAVIPLFPTNLVTFCGKCLTAPKFLSSMLSQASSFPSCLPAFSLSPSHSCLNIAVLLIFLKSCFWHAGKPSIASGAHRIKSELHNVTTFGCSTCVYSCW